MTLTKMPADGNQLIEELASSGYSNAQASRIDIRRKKDDDPYRSLKITFKRTCRVSDNNNTNGLPPDMGAFPLYKITDYEKTLPVEMVAKGGYFFPMYREYLHVILPSESQAEYGSTEREAMWINFTSASKFAVKIYVGGVNAVSGEPSPETGQTKKRRYEMLTSGRTIQDYVVIPQQLWLDGIASEDGKVRQFVAMPLGSGYSIEAQITGADLVGGLQLEVVPAKDLTGHGHQLHIFICTPTGEEISILVSPTTSLKKVKEALRDRLVLPMGEVKLMFEGVLLHDERCLQDYGIPSGVSIVARPEMRGGGSLPRTAMGLAAGGQIQQTIKRDRTDPSIWDSDNVVIFNVQILNSTSFETVTGEQVPDTPVTAEAYAKYDLPYYEIYDEKPSGISGGFAGVESVATKDLQGTMTLEKMKGVAEVVEDTQNPVVLLDQTGQRVGFRPVKLMEKEIMEEFGGNCVAGKV